jgi:hypothetical protein
LKADNEIIDVIVREAVYKEIEGYIVDEKPLNVIDYRAVVKCGTGGYGTYTGILYHHTNRYGLVECGDFSVLIQPDEVFPKAEEVNVKIVKDKLPRLSFSGILEMFGKRQDSGE